MTVEIDLGDKVALVTGAGAGIGREIASWLARAGAAVVINDIDDDRAVATARWVRDAGGEAEAVPADVRHEDHVDRMMAGVVSRFGRLDIAVNNVGMTAGRPPSSFVDTTGDDAAAVIDQNLLSTYLCCLAEARLLVAQSDGGVIINVSSGETTRPATGLAAYGAAKAGINHLAMTMAAELGRCGIRVNAVAPGTTYTDEVRKAIGEEQFAAISSSTPLQRVCQLDELGRLVVFLASDLARCITGQLVLADAGAHLGRIPMEIR